MPEVNQTLTQLLDIYQQSRMRGEEASLSMEAKDGKDFIIENHLDEVFKNTNVTSRKIILKDQLRPENADTSLP